MSLIGFFHDKNLRKLRGGKSIGRRICRVEDHHRERPIETAAPENSAQAHANPDRRARRICPQPMPDSGQAGPHSHSGVLGWSRENNSADRTALKATPLSCPSKDVGGLSQGPRRFFRPHSINSSLPQILLDISDFSSIMAKIRQKRGYYPLKTNGWPFSSASFLEKVTGHSSQSKELSRMDAGSCSPTLSPKEGIAGKEALQVGMRP